VTRKKGTPQDLKSRNIPPKEFLAEQLGADHPLVRPLTDEEVLIKARRDDMNRRRAEGLEYWKKYGERHLEEANRLLFDHEASEEEIAKLRTLKPIPHYGDEPLPGDGEEDTHRCNRKCWARVLEPLRFWPSDLIRVYGWVVLFHPLIIEVIRRLSRIASDPLVIHNPDPVRITAENLLREKLEQVPESKRETRREKVLLAVKKKAEQEGLRSSNPLLEFGFSAIRSLSPPMRYGVALRDETEDRDRSTQARVELQRIFRVLTTPRTGRRRSYRSLRILVEFENLRARGVPEKKAVAELIKASAREGIHGGAGLTEAAIHSAIRDARKRLGRRRIRTHHRGRYREPTEKS
jgi:hypothetical protein